MIVLHTQTQQANNVVHGVPPMKASFDRAHEGLCGLATVEDHGDVSVDRPIPE